ncbi:MAG TPA: archease [Chromatiaceae bacterium]|nr:archease [Chromatiaceae bacterium]
MSEVAADHQPRWEHFHHQADIGVRGWGKTPDEAFEAAALAMTAVVTDPCGVKPLEVVEIECEAPDLELLLVDWLNALAYEMSVHSLLFSRFEIELQGTKLRGWAWGEPVDRSRHQPAVEIKGATYTELQVAQQDGLWVAQCVVDV